MSSTKITTEKVKQVCKLIDKGLYGGLGDAVPGQMCIEQVISYVFDDDGHGDQPKCVDPLLCSFKINLNDHGNWKNNKDRAKGLKRLGIAQLGTKTTKVGAKKFAKRFATELRALAIKRFTEAMPKMMEKSDQLEGLFENLQEINNSFLNREYSDCANNVSGMAHWLNEYGKTNKVLHQYCKDVVQILVKMKTPGSKYLKYTKR